MDGLVKVFGGLRLNDFQFGSNFLIIVLLFLFLWACLWLSCYWWGCWRVYDGLKFGNPVLGSHVSCEHGPVLSLVRFCRYWLMFHCVAMLIVLLLPFLCLNRTFSFGDLFYFDKLAMYLGLILLISLCEFLGRISFFLVFWFPPFCVSQGCVTRDRSGF